ncbi:hypothetical protein RRSWK_00690 [Rhodopirellula sp. SWK7]|nr:hypothetical protein RRSWK_00690 [Rhodopirellula sp. SWK7]
MADHGGRYCADAGNRRSTSCRNYGNDGKVKIRHGYCYAECVDIEHAEVVFLAATSNCTV